MIEMDESEHTAVNRPPWWADLDETAEFVSYNYEEIMREGSDELKNAVTILLGGYGPGGRKLKEESA